jgi:hypothetical protein
MPPVHLARLGPVGEAGGRDRGLTHPQAAHGRDLRTDLGARKMAAGARLGALATLEVKGLRRAHLVPAEAKARRGQLVEVARVGLLFLGQHTAFARADAGARDLGALRQRHLGRRRQRTEAHVGNEQGNRQPQGFLRLGPDQHMGAHRVLVQQWRAMQLRGQDLDVVPGRQLVARHAHRLHRAVVAGLGKAVACITLDQRVVRLLGGAVAGVGVLPKVDRAVEGLRMLVAPGGHFVRIDPDLAVVNPGAEFLQRFGVVVGRDAAVEPVVPVMNAANEVVAFDAAIGHQRASVQAAAVQHRNRIVEAHDDQIDTLDECVRRLPVCEFFIACDGGLVHGLSGSKPGSLKWRGGRQARLGGGGMLATRLESPSA